MAYTTRNDNNDRPLGSNQRVIKDGEIDRITINGNAIAEGFTGPFEPIRVNPIHINPIIAPQYVPWDRERGDNQQDMRVPDPILTTGATTLDTEALREAHETLQNNTMREARDFVAGMGMGITDAREQAIQRAEEQEQPDPDPEDTPADTYRYERLNPATAAMEFFIPPHAEHSDHDIIILNNRRRPIRVRVYEE